MIKSPLSLKSTMLLLCLAWICGIFVWAPAVPLALAREVKVGIYENQPKVFTREDGTPAGIFVDLIEEIARREGWSLHYMHGSWPECLASLESGKIDLMVDVAYSEERAQKFDFCKTDVVNNWAQVYLRRGLNIKLITDLDGMRMATLRRGIHLTRFKKLMSGFGFHTDIIPVDSYDAVFRLLHEEKVDAGIVNRIYGYAHEGRYDVVRSPVVFSPASLRFAVKKGKDADIVTAIDRQLAAMKAAKGSVYHQTLRRWLGETTELQLPQWIAWTLGAAAVVVLLLFLLNLLLKYQVDKKTAHLRLANKQLEEQVKETMKAHLELKRSEEKLVKQARLGALGQLTSGIAHDFNNMLIPILGYSDLLLTNPSLLENHEKVLSILKHIHTAAISSRETVKRLQEFNRADPRPKMEPIKMAELVSEVVEAAKPLWKSQKEAYSIPVRIVEEVPGDLVVTVSKSQIREALMNLLLNALHAMPNGGVVTIRAWTKNESFYLEVTDTGIGMDKEVASRCIEPFFSTKGKGGTGMGLAMVHGIVERHNGFLNIDSTPGRGTTITMQIPLDQQDMGVWTEQDVPRQQHRSLNILVIDDDENSRTLLTEYLTLDGHNVTAAADAKKGVSEFDQGKFDLVITDRAMPEASGDTVARHVKDSGRRVPVLMLTGFAQIMTSRHEHPAGVDYLMGKPFTLQELRNAIEKTIYQRSKAEQPGK